MESLEVGCYSGLKTMQKCNIICKTGNGFGKVENVVSPIAPFCRDEPCAMVHFTVYDVYRNIGNHES